MPKQFSQWRPNFLKILFALTLFLGKEIALFAQGYEEPKVKRYPTWESIQGGKSVLFQNYIFENRSLKFQLPSCWASIEDQNGNFIHLQCTQASDNRVQWLFYELETEPSDEKSAIELYEKKVKEFSPKLNIYGKRVDRRYTPTQVLFPYTFSLGKSNNEPLIKFFTFFIHQKILYIVSLDAPTRTQIGKIQNDWSAMFTSLKIIPKERPNNSTHTASQN